MSPKLNIAAGTALYDFHFEKMPFTLLAWRAFLVALIALALIVTRSFKLAAAFLIGANVALLFSLGLIVWSERLTKQRIVWTEAWRMLKPSQRPAGRAGRRWALSCLSDVALRFAQVGIGFGDCLVCIGAHARDRVAAVATATEKG